MRNEQGFLYDDTDWNMSLMYDMAKENNIVLLPNMVQCIATCRELYYTPEVDGDEPKVPTVDEFVEHAGIDSFAEVADLFKNCDAAITIPMLGGLPEAMAWNYTITG
jgi:sulfur relay (sulfurtransferase) DsrC/TusE family protein